MSKDTSTLIRTYEANNEVLTPISSLMLAIRELHWSRHVIWHLFIRDFVAGFRQKILGYFWIVLTPLIGIASFVFMQKTGILNPGEVDIPYPIYVYIGTTIWAVLVNSITAVSQGLIGNADLVMKTNIPKISLAVTGLANIFYNLVVNLVLLLVLLAIFQVRPSPWIVLYPVALLPIIMLGMGIGLFLAIVGAVARDVNSMFLSVFNLLMYITPVVYTAKFEQATLQSIVAWNPLTYLVDTPRNLVVLGGTPQPLAFLYSAIFALFVLILGVHAFYLIKDKVAERL